jgi:hypothetical protein
MSDTNNKTRGWRILAVLGETPQIYKTRGGGNEIIFPQASI